MRVSVVACVWTVYKCVYVLGGIPVEFTGCPSINL